MLDFYKDQVNKETLFCLGKWKYFQEIIKIKVILFNDAYFQAGLPHLYRDLEKGCIRIAVVGVKKPRGDVFNTL